MCRFAHQSQGFRFKGSVQFVTSRHDQQPRTICGFGMTPETSSSLVPTSSSNESHTRSDEHPARSRYAVQQVSHSFRRPSRSFQIRSPTSLTLVSTSFALVPNSQRTVAINTGQATTVLSEHHNKEQRKRTQRRSATMFAVFLLCVLRATFVHARTRQWAVRTHG